MAEQLIFDGLDSGAVDAVCQVVEDTRGWRGPAVCAIVGITYRQLDYWARTNLVGPSIATAAGSGSVRLYSFQDMVVLRIVKRLLTAGVSLVNIRTAVAALRNRGITDLTGLTLISDGVGIYECTTASDVVDLLAGGQGVFGIAVGAALPDLHQGIRRFPPETLTAQRGPGAGVNENDELAQRRTRAAS